MDTPTPKYLRLHRVCELVGVSRSTLWRWVRAGDFPKPHDLGGGVRLWHTDDLESWLAQQQGQS